MSDDRTTSMYTLHSDGNRDGNEWISPDRAADLCRVSRTTMQTWIRESRVIATGKGARLMVHRPALEEMLRRQASISV